MQELAKQYYKLGYNCSESIVLAANQKYKLGITSSALKMCSCINTGMGIGSLCSGIIAGTMVIGYIFEKKIAPEHTNLKHIRMKFINLVSNDLDGINCSQIIKKSIAKNNCLEVLGIIAKCLEEVIDEFICC